MMEQDTWLNVFITHAWPKISTTSWVLLTPYWATRCGTSLVPIGNRLGPLHPPDRNPAAGDFNLFRVAYSSGR